MVDKTELLGCVQQSDEYPLPEEDGAIARSAYYELVQWCRRYRGCKEFQHLIRLIEERLSTAAAPRPKLPT